MGVSEDAGRACGAPDAYQLQLHARSDRPAILRNADTSACPAGFSDRLPGIVHVGNDLGREPIPDEATITSAPSSTENCDGERDPEMHRTRKGNEWHFGMKVHVGDDSDRPFLVLKVIFGFRKVRCRAPPRTRNASL
jgi:IS5 family transposase